MDRSEDAAAESARIAATAVRDWHEMSVRLSPIIGNEGFRLLFRRSLQLTATRFAWVGGVPALPDSLFSDLELRLKSQTPENAGEASAALVSTFTGLLHTLIGGELTARLLAPPARDPDEQQEDSP
jgi:hypothetical protein